MPFVLAEQNHSNCGTILECYKHWNTTFILCLIICESWTWFSLL